MAKIKLQSISASSRWLQCTASLDYNKTFTANANTTKGNLIHEVSALRLKEIFHKEDNSELIELLKTRDYVDRNDSSIIAKWDSDCEKTSDGYIEYAIRLQQQYEPHTIEVEKKVNLVWYGYEKYGFIDLIMYCDRCVVIVDLKSGRTKIEAESNSQMFLYAIAVIQELRNNPKLKGVVGTYITCICQPLVSNVVAYQYSLQQVAMFYRSKRHKMSEILENKLQFDPSSSACKWCDHRDKCVERIKKGVL